MSTVLGSALTLLTADPAARAWQDAAQSRSREALSLIAPSGAVPFALGLAAHGEHGNRPLLAVTASVRQAEDLALSLTALLEPARVALFPGWETLPHERLSPSPEVVGQRAAVLRRLHHPVSDVPGLGELQVVVAPARALLQPFSADLADADPMHLRPGDLVDFDAVVESLTQLGYQRTSLVERRGDLAVRGGIIDVFPPTASHPVRVEFFGDQVEGMRTFAVADQRSLEEVDQLWAPACRELLFSDAVRERARTQLDSYPQLSDLLSAVAEAVSVPGVEAVAPLVASSMTTLVEALPPDAAVVVIDPQRVDERGDELVATAAEFLAAGWDVAAGGGEVPVELAASGFRTVHEVRESAQQRGMAWWQVGPFDTSEPESERQALHLSASPAPRFRGDLEAAAQEVKNRVGAGEYVAVTAAGLGPAQRIAEALGERGVDAHLAALGAALDSEPRHSRPDPGPELSPPALADLMPDEPTHSRPDPGPELSPPALADLLPDEPTHSRPDPGPELSPPALADLMPDEPTHSRPDPGPEGSDAAVQVTVASLEDGFCDSAAGLTVLTEADLYGASTEPAAARKMPSRRRRAIDPVDLKPGDFVVHEQHGVGRYIEMVERRAAGATREYLVIEYAPSKRGQPGDRLFVPTDQLDQVTRYVGGEAPAVHRLGGADWSKAKGRARKAVRQIVDGLVKLYAARQQTKGRAFGPDTAWQRELEDAFAYTETPDQLACIDEVKADMAQPIPMDRVICGDVGFGKTEIAVRAAFKAVADGAQVVVLTPTTLLARQHLATFRERFAGFPVRVEGLSRFTSEAEAADVLEGLADGSVDVVIGTHRLLNPAIKIKDLGLVIVDEEQRFGVEHKEHLKAMRTNVDVLAMSATPIPRTLEMAVTGIREMSTIATPPEERLPVLTFVGPYNDKQIAAAVRRELARDGQVFFVHNRVASINKVAARLRDLVPEANVGVAHGQMAEGTLEKVMVDFWERELDVLVCTTIVESGLDIPNANTLIVDRAETFGLSQLHQIRGRVGRGRERAYAYFFYDANRPLTETAYERLSTIAGHTELGAGMSVAMKDLEIRGAGNLLGDEQSGHIADIGFDLYVRMVGEALAQVKGAAPEAESHTRVELPLDAHIPHDYITDERLRLEAYRRMAEVDSAAAIEEVLAELSDRYGPVPAPVAALAEVAALRLALTELGITEVVSAGSRIRIEGLALPESLQLRLKRLYPQAVIKPASRTVLLPAPKTARVGGRPLTGTALVRWVEEFIQAVRSLRPATAKEEGQ